MIKFLSMKIKAAILFVVFGLSSFIGFACAIGMDDCFTMHHLHNEESEPPFLLLNATNYNRYCSVALTYILRNFHPRPKDIRVYPILPNMINFLLIQHS